jgi:hypothetical protein
MQETETSPSDGVRKGSSVRLFVATPCFGGMVASSFTASLLKLQQDIAGKGSSMSVRFVMRPDDALITRARATLVTTFLDDPLATHLLFVDADIGFEPEQVMRLIAFDADVCAAVYPVKRIDWNKVRTTVAGDLPNPSAASLHYVLEVEDPSRIVMRDGFIKVRYAGTGFLMMRRSVLERMCARYPELHYRRDHSDLGPLANSPNRYALFDCMIDAQTGTYLSEDFSFCRRWTDMGGEIWADTSSRLSHVGPTTFYGDLSTQFEPQGS